MRYIGIDYGTKRVGVAVSDEDGHFALPLEVMANDGLLVEKVSSLANDVKAEAIILGESKDYKGKDNAIMDRVLSFKEKLERLGVTVHLEPEFMTSAQAERLQGKNAMHDASAAALILQSFLDRDRFKAA